MIRITGSKLIVYGVEWVIMDKSAVALGLSGITVVIPCYRTPGTLDLVCSELLRHVAPLADEFELILVDDGSPDDTWERIVKVVDAHNWVRGIRLARNYGQHNALLAGLRAASHSVVVTMDDDLQNPPIEVPRLIAALDDDTDLVYGTPKAETQTAFRNLASVGTKRLMSKLLGPEVNPKMSAFRVFRRRLLPSTQITNDPYVSIDVLLGWATTNVAVIQVEFDRRKSGTSGYSMGKLIRHTLNMVTGYSIRPLRLVSGLGFAISTFGFALLLYTLTRYAIEPSDVEGFTFLATGLTLFSGVQLLSLGVVGEYLARIHFRTMGRPAYAVRDEIGASVLKD